jgi:AraC family transcriptional regulator
MEPTMRSSQRQDYARRIEQALEELRRCIAAGEPPSLEALAAQAALSPFHFHRVFRLMTGESVGAAITRIRLAHALPALEAATLEEATARSGYATAQAFARALKAQTGSSPSALRADPEQRGLLARLLADAPMDPTMRPALKISVTSTAPLQLVAIRNVGDYRELNRGYGRIFERVLGEVPIEAIVGLYGVPHDDPRDVPAADCRFDCALQLAAPVTTDAELRVLSLDGGACLTLEHSGDYDRIHEAIDALYRHAIEHGLTIGAGSLYIHYLDDPEQVPEAELRAVAYLPITSD